MWNVVKAVYGVWKKFNLMWFPAVHDVALFWGQEGQNVYIANDTYQDAKVIIT